jgi:cysteine synthase
MLKINEGVRKKAVARCRELGVVIPTFAQQKDPSTVPAKVRERLKNVDLWANDPANLFRITWKNEPVLKGGGFGGVNHLEIPSAITGIKARVIGLVGRYFPTGAHKVGAAFGCLVPRLVTGEFDPTSQKAVWPSTGNYCRGGAFDSKLLGCTAVAILPEGMSKERFSWLKEIGAEVIATPGTESNVKEIYDKCWEIKKTRKDCVIFNQFEEFGNYLWHYNVTASAMLDVFETVKGPKSRLAAYVSATGSAGTIGAGDRLKQLHPGMRIGASEALQCPTLLLNGFGEHRIEGIGDKHVPWIHNVRNTDTVVAIDDEACMSNLRLFNEPAGREVLAAAGVSDAVLKQLPLLGISGICNVLSAIKMAKYYELDENDVVFTILTDSADLYQSRLEELTEARGAYTKNHAIGDLARYMHGVGIEHLKDLGYYDRKALHNLKYYTWVEQQGRTSEDLNKLWDPSFWEELHSQIPEWDKAIEAFNAEVAAP